MRCQNRWRALRRSVLVETWSEKLLLLSFIIVHYARLCICWYTYGCGSIWPQNGQKMWYSQVKDEMESIWYCRCILRGVFRWKVLCFMCFRRFQMEVEISIRDTTLLCLSSSHQVFSQAFITFHLPFHWTSWLKQARKHMVRKSEMSPGRSSFNLGSVCYHGGGSPKRPWF